MPDTLRNRKRGSRKIRSQSEFLFKHHLESHLLPLVLTLIICTTILVILSTRKVQPYENIHVVASTGCTLWQNWEAEVLMYSWHNSIQNGSFTRIVSGCKSEEEKQMAMKTAVKSDRIHFFFTENYGGENFQFWNKAFSFRDWLSSTNAKEDIIVLLEPDMIIRRPFQTHLPLSDEYVSLGRPIAARYGIGGGWVNWNLCKKGDCSLSPKEASKYYSIGPPYALHRADWEKVSCMK